METSNINSEAAKLLLKNKTVLPRLRRELDKATDLDELTKIRDEALAVGQETMKMHFDLDLHIGELQEQDKALWEEFINDPEVSEVDILETSLARDKLNPEKFREYARLRIASIKAWNNWQRCRNEKDEERAEKYLKQHGVLAKKIGLILMLDNC